MNKNTSIRLGDTLDELIDEYALCIGKKRSRIIREILMEGLFQKTKAVQFRRFEEWINKRETFDLMKYCEKCGRKEHLGFYHIDGDINNNAPSNIVTLCIPCITEFQNWKLKQNIKEKFIEWFFA